MNFLATIMVMKRLDKEDKKFIAPHFRAGVVTPQDLRKIADVCEKFPESKIKLGTEIIIGGITEKTRNEEFRRMLREKQKSNDTAAILYLQASHLLESRQQKHLLG